ncbi:MAG: YgjV family protein [Ruminococcus sp.]|nr:YgjV family protein [Ruminococcus sp.]
MEKHIIIGNFFSMGSMILIMVGGLVKTKSRFILIQLIHNILAVVSGLLICAPTAVISAATSCVRDYITYKNKMTFNISLIIAAMTVIMAVVCNGAEMFGYVPLIAMIPYAFLIAKTDNIQTKFLTIYTMILWCIYDFGTKNYIGSIFDVITITTCINGIFELKELQRIKANRLAEMLADII